MTYNKKLLLGLVLIGGLQTTRPVETSFLSSKGTLCVLALTGITFSGIWYYLNSPGTTLETPKGDAPYPVVIPAPKPKPKPVALAAPAPKSTPVPKPAVKIKPDLKSKLEEDIINVTTTLQRLKALTVDLVKELKEEYSELLKSNPVLQKQIETFESTFVAPNPLTDGLALQQKLASMSFQQLNKKLEATNLELVRARKEHATLEAPIINF